MLLNPNLEIFRNVPESFVSPFASADSRLSQKYQAIAKAAGDAKNLLSIGERLLCQQQAQAWRDGLALINYAKATAVGDILMDALPKVAWVSKNVPAGLFAKVAFPQSTDPARLAEALINVALDIAIAAISSVPIVGQILGAVVQVARFIYRIFTTPKEAEPELLLPWSDYSENVDEDLVRHFLWQTYGQGVDWTPIWLPLRARVVAAAQGSAKRQGIQRRSGVGAGRRRRDTLRAGPARVPPEHDPRRGPPTARPGWPTGGEARTALARLRLHRLGRHRHQRR
ncbi:hypothetical protein [Nannocystis pusilla]|uniref:hypothetical protein n=1 Tax=Nannocystis pusilla TaxID=889268 RepID=UPI003B81ED90